MSTLNRSQEPELKLPAEINLPSPEIIQLNGNIPLLIVNQGTQDVIKLEFVFSAGTVHEKTPMLATITNDLLDEGTEHHTSAELAEALDSYGAYLQTECGQDWASATLFTLTKYLNKTLPVFLEILLNPVFPDEELSTYITQSRQHLAVSLEKTDYLARKHFMQAMYEGHPYGHFPSLSDFNRITRDQLTAFHKSNYVNGLRMVSVAGKFDNAAVDSIKSIISAFGFKNDISYPDYQFSGLEKKNIRIAKSGAVQSTIRVGMRLFNRHHPDFFLFTILNTVLGGYFGSRLMSNIREDKGYTYGIGSALVPLYNDGYFFIGTDVGAEVTENALKEIYYEVNHLAEECIPEEELSLVKSYLFGVFQRSIDGPFALSDKYKQLILNNLQVEHYTNYIFCLKNTAGTELQEIAKKHLKTIRFSEVIIHPE